MARQIAKSLEEAKELWPEIPLGQAKNWTNKKFGNLICLYRTINVGTVTRWVCKCDCGNYQNFNIQHLVDKGITSCGCLNREKASQRMLAYNLNNQEIIPNGTKFGKLTVIDYLGMRKEKSRNKNTSWYLCQCDCGSAPVEAMGNQLITNSKKSCGCMHSYGEYKIKLLLDNQKIKYKTEFSFNDLKNPNTNLPLRFDFLIFNNQDELFYLIEFDGRQHYTGPEAIWTQGASLEEIQYKDKLKNQYCLSHNIPLIRIPYIHLNKLCIEDLLLETTTYLVKE